MTFEIQNPRAGQTLTEAFDLRGRVRPELEEYIVPVVTVGSLDMGLPPAIQRTVTYYAAQGAVSGERFVFQLAVPPGIIAVIKRMILYGRIGDGRALLCKFAGATSGITTPATTAGSCFTDGRLAQSGVEPSSKLYYNTQVSNISGSDWALPLYHNMVTWDTGVREFEPKWGWVVGSGNTTEPGFFEGTFDIANAAMHLVLETEEFQSFG